MGLPKQVEKVFTYFGNAIAENVRKKKKEEQNCGNSIAEIGKKNLGNCGIVENGRGKKLNGIVAMSLPKMGGKKIVVGRNLGKNFKKKVLRSQYFYNTFTTNHR